jgi:hypothetical protein
LPNIFSSIEFSHTVMKSDNRKKSFPYDIGKNCSLVDRVFTGCLLDAELNINASGYFIEYALGVKSYRVEGDTCVIDYVDLCVGTKTENHKKTVDIKTEIASLNKEAKRYDLLASSNPDGAMDGLSYVELAKAHKDVATELTKVHDEVLSQIKLQIKDRLNSHEDINCKVIDITNVNRISFSKCRPNLGMIKWKRVS